VPREQSLAEHIQLDRWHIVGRRIAMKLARKFAIGTSLLVIACSEPTRTGAGSGSGTWVRHESHPGNHFEMSLASQGGRLAGTGDFAEESGPAGRFVVGGFIAHDTVTLDFTFATQLPEGQQISTGGFTGSLIFGMLRGAMSTSESTTIDTVVFDRKQ
jgi:hypothetical protein